MFAKFSSSFVPKSIEIRWKIGKIWRVFFFLLYAFGKILRKVPRENQRKQLNIQLKTNRKSVVVISQSFFTGFAAENTRNLFRIVFFFGFWWIIPVVHLINFVIPYTGKNALSVRPVIPKNLLFLILLFCILLSW